MEPRPPGRTAIQKMAATHCRRRTQEARQAAERAVLARGEVERLKGAFLTLAPDIEKIVLFGSLASGASFRSGSDIDLAVRCRPETFLRLVAEALRSPFPVDVIDLSTADARMLAAIEQGNEVIYAK